MSSGIWILILNVKWRNRTEQHFHFPPSAGYWEGSEKTSWWCHCSSQGRKHYCSFSFETILLFLFLLMACKFATYWIVQVPDAVFFIILPMLAGKSNAWASWTLYQRVCKRLWSWGAVFFLQLCILCSPLSFLVYSILKPRIYCKEF